MRFRSQLFLMVAGALGFMFGAWSAFENSLSKQRSMRQWMKSQPSSLSSYEYMVFRDPKGAFKKFFGIKSGPVEDDGDPQSARDFVPLNDKRDENKVDSKDIENVQPKQLSAQIQLIREDNNEPKEQEGLINDGSLKEKTLQDLEPRQKGVIKQENMLESDEEVKQDQELERLQGIKLEEDVGIEEVVKTKKEMKPGEEEEYKAEEKQGNKEMHGQILNKEVEEVKMEEEKVENEEEAKPKMEVKQEREAKQGEKIKQDVEEKAKVEKKGEHNEEVEYKVEAKPKEEEVNPKAEEVRPKEEEVKPKEEEVKPKEEEVTPKEEEVKPKEEVIKPKEEVIKPNEEEVNPKEEEVKPKEEEVNPKEEEENPKKEEINPKEEEIKPKEAEVKTEKEEHQGENQKQEEEKVRMEEKEKPEGEVDPKAELNPKEGEVKKEKEQPMEEEKLLEKVDHKEEVGKDKTTVLKNAVKQTVEEEDLSPEKNGRHQKDSKLEAIDGSMDEDVKSEEDQKILAAQKQDMEKKKELVKAAVLKEAALKAKQEVIDNSNTTGNDNKSHAKQPSSNDQSGEDDKDPPAEILKAAKQSIERNIYFIGASVYDLNNAVELSDAAKQLKEEAIILVRAAARDKSNYVLQEVAAEAVKEAKEALALRKGAEKMDSREIKEVLKEVESGKVDVSDEVFVPPELRKRKPIPEDEVEGNPYNCYCGQSDDDPSHVWKNPHKIRIKRMINGKEVLYNQYPWVLEISTTKRMLAFCGATLLNRKWVVTTAACAQMIGGIGHVLFEQHQLINGINGDVLHQYTNVIKRILTHPKFDFAKKLHNIALLELTEPVNFQDKIKPICWPTLQPQAGDDLHVAGWGEKIEGKHLNHMLSNSQLTVISHEKCNEYYHGRVDNSSFCTYNGPTYGTCHGDQGGAATWKVDGSWEIAGVTTWAYSCAKMPDTYINMSAYESWWRPLVGKPSCPRKPQT